MRPSWFLYLYSFRNESRKKKAYAFCRRKEMEEKKTFYPSASSSFPRIGPNLRRNGTRIEVLSSSRVGLETVQISIPLKTCGAKWRTCSDTNEQHRSLGWKESRKRFGTTSLRRTSSLSTNRCHGACRRWSMPKAVTQNTRCVLICLSFNSSQ